MQLLRNLKKIQTRNNKVCWFLRTMVEELQQVNTDYYNSVYNIEQLQLTLKDKRQDALDAINNNDLLIDSLITALDENEVDDK